MSIPTAHTQQVGSDALRPRSTGTADRKRSKDQPMARLAVLATGTTSVNATGDSPEGERVRARQPLNG